MSETGQDPRGTSPGSADAPRGADPLHGAREQGTAARRRHGSRRMRMLVTAGAVTAVAAASVTTSLFTASGSGAPSALAAVTSALAKTSADSYSFSLDSTQPHIRHVISGMVDPRHNLGAELLTTTYQHHPVKARILFIGDYVYTWVSPGSGLGTVGKPWNKAPVPPPQPGYGFVSDQPVSPADLSGVLRYPHTVRNAGPASAPGWTGIKYAFTARLPGGTVSGTVYVDRQGRVRRLITTVTLKHGIVIRRDITFDDLGAQEAVTAPPPSQIKYTSYPYWGFYF